MRDLAGKTYWLVGASEGLGRALAKALTEEGARLVLSARSRDRLEELADEIGGAAVVPVDVTDDASVASAVAEVGQIDGLVWLAGVYWPMAATEWNAEHATLMAEVNFAGAVRVLGHVVPPMVKRDAGHVVLVGSLSGFRGLPGAIGYAASKAGLMSLGQSMHADLRGTGVKVQLANPGFIRTRLTDKNDFRMPFLMEPDEAAAEVLFHMKSRRFQRNFPRLFGAMFRWSQLLPDWAYYRMFS